MSNQYLWLVNKLYIACRASSTCLTHRFVVCIAFILGVLWVGCGDFDPQTKKIIDRYIYRKG